MEKLQQRLASQEEMLAQIERQRAEVKAAASEVSKDFDRLDGLLALVRKMKKQGASEEEINREIASYKARVKGAELEIEV